MTATRPTRILILGAGQGETPIRRLGPGDCFGEIALIRGVPRTATVTASGDLRLVALESEPFLAAVSGNLLSTDEAQRIVGERCDAIERPLPPPGRPAHSPKKRPSHASKKRTARRPAARTRTAASRKR